MAEAEPSLPELEARRNRLYAQLSAAGLVAAASGGWVGRGLLAALTGLVGQASLRAVRRRYSQSMMVEPTPRSWRRARSARSRSSAATRCGSSPMPR